MQELAEDVYGVMGKAASLQALWAERSKSPGKYIPHPVVPAWAGLGPPRAVGGCAPQAPFTVYPSRLWLPPPWMQTRPRAEAGLQGGGGPHCLPRDSALCGLERLQLIRLRLCSSPASRLLPLPPPLPSSLLPPPPAPLTPDC